MIKRGITIVACVASLCGCMKDGTSPKMNADTAHEIIQDVKRRNLAYEPLTERDDTMMQQVVEYYNTHGTANERMEAYYLLGCVYRDLHEAPRAMEAFLKGIETADVQSKNCRYDILVRIYGQKNEILYHQELVRQAIEGEDSISKYATLASDTLYIVKSMWNRIGYLFLMGDYKTIADSCWEYLRRSKELRQYEYAAGLLNTSTLAFLELGRADDAGRLLSIYEQHSGEVNPETHECSFPIYYYTKGRLLLTQGRLDSAELFFRREMHEPDWNNRQSAYRGLRGVFEQTGQADSALKYARLQCEAVDSDYQTMLSANLQNLKEMYDYSRIQRDSHQKDMLIQKGKRRIQYICFIFGLVVMGLTFLVFYLRSRYRQMVIRAELELEQANGELNEREWRLSELYSKIAQAEDNERRQAIMQEVENAERIADEQFQIVKEKEEKLEKLHAKSLQMRKNRRKRFQGNRLFCQLLHKANARKAASAEDFAQVWNLLNQEKPMLNKHIEELPLNISDIERKTIILLHLGLTKTETAELTAHSLSAITNICNRMYEKAHGRKCTNSAEAYEWIMQL